MTEVNVVLVDDNQFLLDAMALALEGREGIHVVGGFSHNDLLASEIVWEAVDMVIVDAADEERSGDQFPGVGVVRHVRANAGASPVIVVVTGHFFDDGLRHRMAQERADLFFQRSEIRSAELVAEIVLHPDRFLRSRQVPGADPEALEQLGVGRRARVNDAVAYLEEHGVDRALDATASRRHLLSRRALIRHRNVVGSTFGIEPVNATTGGPPVQDGHRWNQVHPSLRQLSRLWAWAARVKHSAPPPMDDREC